MSRYEENTYSLGSENSEQLSVISEQLSVINDQLLAKLLPI
ncbi:MAG: hypothetical protein AAGG00_03300 [Cyanobacteria bacterium P01_H01_bin.150]